MMTAKRMAASGIAALALASCGNGADAPATSTAATDSATAVVALTEKGAPKRADGYWRLEHIGGGGTTIGTQFLCIGAGSEERASVFDQIALNFNCSRYDITGSGANWAFDFVCGAQPMVSEANGAVTGDFVNTYKIEQQVTEADFTQERTIVATNDGACPAGIAPGDLMDENGEKVTNILD